MLIAASTIWGTTFVVGKLSLQFFGSLYLGFLENMLGGAILLVALVLQEKRNPSEGRPEFFRNRKTFLLGALNGVAYTLQYMGLRVTDASKAGLLVNAGVTFVPLFAFALLHDPLRRREAAALATGIIGAALISTGGSLVAITQGGNIGDLFVMLAGIIWALWIVVAQASINEMKKPLRVAAPNAIYTAVLMGAVAALGGEVTLDPLIMPMQLLYVIYLGVMSIGVAYVLYYAGLKQTGSTASAIYLLLQSVVAMALGILLLSESASAAVLLGALLILCAIRYAATDDKNISPVDGSRQDESK
jgi:drug/metabolite transporter (DMT)-like permease